MAPKSQAKNNSQRRVTRQVRIKKKTADGTLDPDTWVDVEILVASSTLGTNGQEHLRVFGPDANPIIHDPTGDFGDQNVGGKSIPSRSTHLVRCTGTTDAAGNDVSDQMLDVEVLDVMNIFGLGEHFSAAFDFGTNTINHQKVEKDLQAVGQEELIQLDSDSIGVVNDQAGLGFKGDGTAKNVSRATHTDKIVELTQQTTDSDGVPCYSANTDDIAQSNQQMPPTTNNFLALLKVDALAFLGTNGDENFLHMPYTQKKIDATDWTVDDNGDKAPPDWTPEEKNPYVVWPEASQGPWVGIPNQTLPDGVRKMPINQGPLWWIKRVSAGGHPWYWYQKSTQQYEFTFFFDPSGGHFALLPNYARIVDGYHPDIGGPIPVFGFDSLDGDQKDIQNNTDNTPDGQYGAASDGFTALNNMQTTYFKPDIGDFTDQDVPGHAGGMIGITIWGPWGLLGGAGGVNSVGANTSLGSPMTCDPDNGFRQVGILGGFYWKIWEMCGIKRPPLQDPHKPYDRMKNPYVPTVEDAKKVALAFRDQWNNSADAMNNLLFHAPVLTNPHQSSGGPPGPFTPPGWAFTQPFYDTYDGLNLAWSFNGPVNASIAHFPAVDVTFPVAPHIGVAQLDQKKWDTTLFPPVLRSLDWSKTPFRTKPDELTWIEFFTGLNAGGGD